MIRIVRNNKLFEDFFDDNINAADDEVESINDVDKEINSESVDTTEYTHNVCYNYIIKDYNDLKTVSNNIKQIVPKINYYISNMFFIDDEYSLTLRMDEKGKNFPSRANEDKIKQNNLFNSNVGSLFDDIITQYEQNNSKASIIFDIKFSFNICCTCSASKINKIINILDDFGNHIEKYIQKLCAKKIQHLMFIDDESAVNDYAGNIKTNSFWNIFKAISDKEYFEYENEHIDRINNIRNRKKEYLDIPEELKLSIPNNIIEYISNTKMEININDNNVEIIFPENVNVTIRQVLCAWYYIKKYYSSIDSNHTVSVSILGSMNMENNIYPKYGEWYDCIECINKLICNGTKFNTLDLNILKKIYVDEVVINHPQTTTRSVSMFSNKIHREDYKNKNVVISSETHSVDYKTEQLRSGNIINSIIFEVK